jgi:hypothetical protein
MPAPAPAPVLTGVPVSGMAYLDRPAPAGYFIFPDLSVRHEGRYRLRFALYEETKDEPQYQLPADPLEPREFCTHRLDVKSKAFTVFSAKKFPGLAESTALSRIVAEQGCRVRIRRDVRMRRRNERTRRESEDGMDETAMLRANRHHTPDQYEIESQIRAQNQYNQPTAHPMQRSESIDRKRSGSDASIASMHDVPAPQRYEGGYPSVTPSQNHGPFVPPAPAHNANEHLTFGGGHSAPPLAPPHPPQALYNRYQQPMPPQQPPQNQYITPAQSQYGSRENSMPLPSQHYQQQQPPILNAPLTRRGSTDFVPRRESNAGYMPSQQQQYRPPTPSIPQYNGQMPNGYGQPQPQQQYPSQQAYPPHPASQQAPATSNALPPPPTRPQLPAMEPKLGGWSQPTTPNGTAPPALPSPSAYGPTTTAAAPQPRAIASNQLPQAPAPPHPNQFPSYYPDQNKLPTSTGYANGTSAQTPAEPPNRKRPWGRVFNTAHTEGPMFDGGRPSDSNGYGSDPTSFAADDDDEYDLGKLKMSYRRADGAEIVRRLPGGDI